MPYYDIIYHSSTALRWVQYPTWYFTLFFLLFFSFYQKSRDRDVKNSMEEIRDFLWYYTVNTHNL